MVVAMGEMSNSRRARLVRVMSVSRSLACVMSLAIIES